MSDALWLLPLVLSAGLAACWFTLRPLRKGALAGMGGPLERDDRVAARKAAALESLRELEWDYQLGSLEEREYHALRQEMEAQALRTLKAEDAEAAEAAALERAVAVAVERARAGLSLAPTCHTCGRTVGATDTYCAGCGARLTDARGRAANPAGWPGDPLIQMPEAQVTAGAWVAATVAAVVQNGVALDSQEQSTGPSIAPLQARPRAVTASVNRPRRPVYVAVATALAVAFTAGTLWLTLSAPARVVQQPLASLPAQQVPSLAIDPADPRRILAASNVGLLASADGGRSWQALPAPRGEIAALAVPAGRPGAVYAAAIDRLVRSDDGGQSWTPLEVGLPTSRPRALAADPQAPDRLYAIVGDGATLLRSDDAGGSWTPLTGQRLPADATTVVVVPGGPDTQRLLFAGTIGGGVLASGDEGASWGNASGFVNGALPTTPVRSLAYDAASGDRFEGTGGARFSGALYAGTDAGLFKSTDGGTSWTRLPLDARVVAVAASPTDSRVLLAVDNQARLFRSEDRGLTWPGGAAR